MRCNCKANKEIMKIYKNYGHKIDVSWKKKIKFRLIEGFKVILISLLCILFFPLIFIFVLIYSSKNNRSININKLLNKILRKNEKE